MDLSGPRSVRTMIAIIVGLVLLRLVCGALTPLAFDEAYYWTWSKRLAGGYYDHPPMVALVIRLGTMLAGDTELGVRLISILLALPMSFAVYRAAAILFPARQTAIDAVLLLNATLLVSVGTVIITPDAPLLVASSFVLFTLAKLVETDRGEWWLAVGVAVGVGLLSKYTALFFGPVILIWLLLVPSQRKWLTSPWPYIGGVIAFALFSPVIYWNAKHGWVSFLKQFGRATAEGFSPSSFLELVPTQFVVATPLVFFLGALGLHLLIVKKAGEGASRILITATIGIIAAYFAWHALHSRVEGNWLAPIYPAGAITAAVAANGDWRGRTASFVAFCRRWALPSGVALFVVLVIQANTGFLTGSFREGTARAIGIGWQAIARDVEAARIRTGATCVIGSDYSTTSWLMFYLPKGSCVVSQIDRIRWGPEPPPSVMAGKLLFLYQAPASVQAFFRQMPMFEGLVATLIRRRGPLVIDTFQLDLLDGSKGDILDRSPPVELQR